MMIGIDPFDQPDAGAFFRLLADEADRCSEQARPLAVLRIEARNAMPTVRDLFALYRAVAGGLRRSDRVHAVGGVELAAILADADGCRADAVAGRVRAAALSSGRWRVRLGCATVGPAGWQEAWRLAGALLIADAAVPAAA